MFSLEQLSKIKNAKEDATILSFFGVLENSVGNESLKFGENVISSDALRSDEIVPFHNPELIRNNFPEREGDYLKVPKVV